MRAAATCNKCRLLGKNGVEQAILNPAQAKCEIVLLASGGNCFNNRNKAVGRISA